MDSIVGLEDCQKFRGCQNIVYNRASLNYLMEQGITATYCPVGYNDAYAQEYDVKKTIDISFVGTPYKKRLRVLEPIAEAAAIHNWNLKIYAQSRICLNIHDERNKGTNPRTFEIMAVGSFELLDSREDYDILTPDRDMAVYHNSMEAVKKIEYYLKHVVEREEIAVSGHSKVMDIRSIRLLLQQILEIK